MTTKVEVMIKPWNILADLIAIATVILYFAHQITFEAAVIFLLIAIVLSN